MSVTYSTKCYTYVCAGCGLLEQSERRDTLTCSTACRVRAHRNGWLKTLRDIAKTMEVRPGRVVQVQAYMALCPDWYEREKAGEKIATVEAERETNKRFYRAMMAQIRAEVA